MTKASQVSLLRVPQLDLRMEEAEDEVKVDWGVSQLETRELQVTPAFTQVKMRGRPVSDIQT